MKKTFSCLAGTLIFVVGHSQNNSSPLGEIHGNFQADAQYYIPDSTIGANAVPEKLLMNGFCNLNYTHKNFSAGLRYESYLNAMQGYDPRYKGSGIPYRYASYVSDEFDITVGNFYEQFGNGLILRAYEERGLGLDNAFDGIRVKYRAFKGIYLKGLIGKQRFFFSQGEGIVRGFDGEINFNETFTCLAEKKTQVILGGSFVSKFQPDNDPLYVLPENVGCYGGRINISHGGINFNGEYAYKINDPSAVNNYSYKPGQAAFGLLSYSKKGFGLSLGGIMVDNMYYKSDRTAPGAPLSINYIPALTRQHTFPLMAFYPFGSKLNGEMGGQAELNYKFKKETPLGGKYGMDLTINCSAVNGLDTTQLKTVNDSARMLYTTKPFSMNGETYFRDLNIEINKKLSPKVRTTIMYANQVYNMDRIQDLAGHGIIYSDIVMLEITYLMKPGRSIRTELEHLATKQDKQNWAEALIEYTPSENWFVAASDQYNYGNNIASERFNYYNFQVGYIKNTNRVTLGYGRQRAGIFCVGGVCRYVPAANGITLSVTSSF